MLNSDHDVLLARKPLGGWSCASCGTNLAAISSMPAKDHTNWSRLPNKDVSLLNYKMINGINNSSKSLSKV